MAFNSLDMPDIVKGQGSGFGDFLNWVGDTFFGGSHHTNDVNQSIAEQNIEFQKWANEQNIAFQTEQNNITRQREDTAVQRAAADMTAAGLSKTLAAGNPASAQALTAPQVHAPNNSFQMQRNLAGMNLANMVSDLVFKAKEAKRAQKLNDAQVANIEADTVGKTISNEGLRDRLIAENALSIAKTEETQAQVSYIKAQTRIQEIVGDNKQREIDSAIASQVQERIESMSRQMVQMKEIEKMASEIALNVIKETNLNLESDKIRNEIELLIKEQTKAQLEMDVIDYNLGYSKEKGLRTTDQVSRLLGLNITNFGDKVSDLFNPDPDSYWGKIWHNLTTPLWEWVSPF